MKQIRKASSLRQAGKLILALAMFLLLTSVVLAQSGGGYDLSWSTMDGGGGTSEGVGTPSLVSPDNRTPGRL
jgi:hypothetical protein